MHSLVRPPPRWHSPPCWGPDFTARPRSCRLAVRPSKTSKAFWDAMSKVQSHLTDAKKIAAYNDKKEAKLKVQPNAGQRCAAAPPPPPPPGPAPNPNPVAFRRFLPTCSSSGSAPTSSSWPP